VEEITVRQEIFRALVRAGFAPITQTDTSVCARCGYLNHPPIGRPDILVLNPTGPSFVVECKICSTSLPKAHIRPEQRKWLNWWCREMGGMGFIALGVTGARSGRKGYHLALVPWPDWCTLEEKYGERESVPAAHRGTLNPDLAPYTLTWSTGQGWVLPQNILGLRWKNDGHHSLRASEAVDY